jgi:hypothetical protein
MMDILHALPSLAQTRLAYTKDPYEVTRAIKLEHDRRTDPSALQPLAEQKSAQGL